MPRWTIGVDTGGTFTDCIARCDDGSVRRSKVPSSGELRARILGLHGHLLTVEGLPAVPAGFWTGFEVVVYEGPPLKVLGSRAAIDPTPSRPHRDGSCAGLSSDHGAGLHVTLEIEPMATPPHLAGTVARIRCGCAAPVLAARIAIGRPPPEPLSDVELRVGTTIGTNALLEGRTARVMLVTTAGLEDALLIGDQRRRDIFALAPSRRPPMAQIRVGIRERMSATGAVITALSTDDVRRAATMARDSGYESIAVAFVHASANPAHERAAALMLADAGLPVVTSAETAVSGSFLPRANAAAIEAALRPTVGSFVGRLRRDAIDATLFLSASSGSPVPAADFMAKDCLLSGPATGVAAAAAAAAMHGFDRCVTLDVGGTSADASRATLGVPDLARLTTVADVELASPCVAVESVAAGGGSLLWFDGHSLRVGPRSAGASPGPACYGAGGPLTLTDAHLLLGRIDPELMPIPIDVAAAERAAGDLLAQVNAARTAATTRDALLAECIAIADEVMAGALRTSLARVGESATDHALVAFGGAGGLHACAVADLLSMPAVILPADAGLLCAQGACETPLQRDEVRIAHLAVGSRQWHDRTMTLVRDAIACAEAVLRRWGVRHEGRTGPTVTFSVRRSGQEEGLPVPIIRHTAPEDDLARAIREGFELAWHVRFGTPPDERPLEIEEIRVRCAGVRRQGSSLPSVGATVRNGPALISRMGSTAWVPDGWLITEHADGAATLIRQRSHTDDIRTPPTTTPADAPAHAAHPRPSTERIASALSAAATEMGEQLRRTSLSVNVRDRLDFSCGILDADGQLIVNAPHIPVHLGALGACVRAVRAARPIAAGDAWCVNHPRYGGAHLPDVTVIAPVHERDDPGNPGAHLGFVAARAHHAEIGGSRPGSMPPDATRLSDEGAVIPPTLVAARGRECLDEVERMLRSGAWPSRCPEENIADLRAQLAALVTGRHALRSIAHRAGIHSLRLACSDIAAASADAARDAIRACGHIPVAVPSIHAVHLDDGTPLRLSLMRTASDSLVLDFTGTGGPHPGNLNMPESVTRATILYVIRLLVAQSRGREGMGLPVAESLLDPISIVLPRGTILSADIGEDPALSPAVAVGQTDTAQRLVDLLLSALGLAAESQGTMNNLLLGGSDWGFYETVCGGAGGSVAGPGCDAIHTHLTNTRITDVEVLERRHPVRVERFAVRTGSGGAGANPGGAGAIRAIRFLERADGSFLSQHRATPPRGIHGGCDGAIGTQRIEHPDGTVTALEGRAAFDAQPGDLLVIETPGGGGFGTPT